MNYSKNTYIEARKLLDDGYKYAARDMCGNLYFYSNEPLKSFDNWVCCGGKICMRSIGEAFDFISWEDKTPFELETVLKYYKPDMSEVYDNGIFIAFPRKVKHVDYELYTIEYIGKDGLIERFENTNGVNLFTKIEADQILERLTGAARCGRRKK